VAARRIQLRYPTLPSGLASYPRVVMTRRPDLLQVGEPPEIEVRVDRVRIDPAQLAAYAGVCGHAPAAGLPVTYPHVLAMPLHLRIMADAAFELRPIGLIHLSNTIRQPGTLQPGGEYSLRVAACRYRKLDAGYAFDMDTELSDAGGPVWLETCVFMSRWPAAAERPASRPPRPPKAPRDSAVLQELDVTRELVRRYAWVSRDFNPIHLSDRIARYLGLRGAISHGMWSLARSLAAEPCDAAPAGGRLETQFLTPVQLPARVAIKRWEEEGVARRAMCDVRTGRVHMYAWWTAADRAAGTASA
jgi:acyl dehydratase